MKKLLRADMMEREAGYRIIDERYFDRAENVSKLKFTQKSTMHIFCDKYEIKGGRGVLSKEIGKVQKKFLV